MKLPRPKIMIFDLKRDYLGLADLFDDRLVIRIPEDFKWNPLEPPIRDWLRWAGIFASWFSDSCGFFGGSSTENFFYQILLDLGRRFDIKNGVFPCLLDLRDHLEWLKLKNLVDRYSEEKNWFARIRNRVNSLCNSYGDMIDCSRGYPLCELLEHDVLYDISQLKPDSQTFFMENHIGRIVLYRMESDERGGIILNIGIMDEAKRLFPKYRDDSQKSISNISYLVAMAREFGIGFIFSDNDPHLLSNSIKSNCYTRFCFNQNNGTDIIDSCRSLGLDSEQAGVIQKLEVGEAIVRLAGRINRPFVVKVIP